MPQEPAPLSSNGASAAKPVLSFEKVSAGYGRTEVLHSVTLRVPPATAVALVGPNGAGKTSLLRVGSGALRPTSGSVLLDGKDVSRLDVYARTKLGICDIPEGRGIFPSLTVRENIILQSPRHREEEGIAQAVELFPVLGRRLQQIAGSMSGGEQQMLSVVRSYLANPRIVLFDELSLGLAPIIIGQIYDYIARVLERGVAVLIVEQYVNRVLQIADQVYLLDKGGVAISGTAEEVRRQDLFAHYMGIGTK